MEFRDVVCEEIQEGVSTSLQASPGAGDSLPLVFPSLPYAFTRGGTPRSLVFDPP
jgi:hypothetical protein